MALLTNGWWRCQGRIDPKNSAESPVKGECSQELRRANFTSAQMLGSGSAIARPSADPMGCTQDVDHLTLNSAERFWSLIPHLG